MRVARKLRSPFGLAALAVLSEAGYVALLRLNWVNGVRPVLTFLLLMAGLFVCCAAAVPIARRSPQRSAIVIVAAGAVIFRLTLLPGGVAHGPTGSGMIHAVATDLRGDAVAYERFLIYDSDIWRYLWDGHVWAHGSNPYRHAPADPALDGLGRDGVWQDIRDNINHPTVPTIYPPFAMGVFRVAHWLAPGSVFAMKALLAGFDLLAAALIALTLRALGRPPAGAILYAWNPLVIKVFAGSGHVDSVLVAALAACAYLFARNRRLLGALAFGVAVLAKIAPIVLLPLVIRRAGLRNTAIGGAAIVAGYVPFLAAGTAMFAGMAAFAHEWRFNAGPFQAIRFVTGEPVARAISSFLILGLAAAIALRDDGRRETFATYAAPLLGCAIILSPVVMPWYMTSALALAVIAGQTLWFWFSALVCCAFLVMVDGTEHAWALWLEYGAFAVLLGTRVLKRKTLGGRTNEEHQHSDVVSGPEPAGACRSSRQRIECARPR